MSCLIFAHAKSIYNKAHKHANNMGMQKCLTIDDDQERKEIFHQEYERSYNLFLNTERAKFCKILDIAQMLHNDYMKITNKQWYMITIRPNTKTVSFDDFYNKIRTLMDRQCFLQYTLSFEQKGTTKETIGEGFHVHIITETSHRSKGECLRDLLSTFKKWINQEKIAEQCIDVRPTKQADNIIQNYLINYESEDHHKIKTKETDTIWREALKLEPIYKDHVPQRTSLTNKPVTVRDVSCTIIKNPLITFQ